jgi:hypothetical protein
VSVAPQSPGPRVLCTLGVQLKNAGTHTATDFRFKVKIDCQDVATYNIESFAVNVGPGASDPIALYSFWTASRSRRTTLTSRLEWSCGKAGSTVMVTDAEGAERSLVLADYY